MKNNNKDLILIGDVLTNFVTYSTATLISAFLLRATMLYQIAGILGLLVTFLMNRLPIIQKRDSLFKYRKKLLTIESIVDVFIIVLVVIFGGNGNKALIIVNIANVLLKPINQIQTNNNFIFMSENFSKEARLKHDLKKNDMNITINILALVAGLGVNMLNPIIGVVLIYLTEILNNIFYIKQKEMK